MQEPFTQPSSLPFQENSMEEFYYTRPEKKPRHQRQARASQETQYSNDRPAGGGKPGRMTESDCAKYWNDLTLHGHIPRRDKDMILDRMRITRDQCTKAFFNNNTNRMERVTESNPTPLLDISIMMGNGRARSFAYLPDSGTTKAIVSKDLAIQLGIKFAPVPFDHILTDAQGVAMNVEGMGVLKARAENVDGSLNKNGEFHLIPCIVSSTLNNDIFLAWSDLINIGSLAPYIPEVWSSKKKWLEHRATLTPEQRCRNTKLQRLDPAIEKLFDRYPVSYTHLTLPTKRIV